MTVAQLQNLQAFVTAQLADVVDWGKHVRPDPEKKTSGDQAFIAIATPFNRYRMSVATSYIEPPPGAPVACKSLGWVTFDDPGDTKHILGPKSDNTYAEISKHIHVRELTDAIAVARREMAEAGAETAAAARVKLAELAAKGAKWGIAAKVPEGPASQPLPERPAAERSLPDARLMEAVDLSQVPAAAAAVGDYRYDDKSGGSRPWLGAPVLFITNPGEQISGMQEIPGTCVKVLANDRISVFMMPDHSEPSYRDNLPRRGTAAGNGRVHQFNCWDFNPAFVREQKRVLHLEEAIAKMADEGNQDRAMIDELLAQTKRLGDRIIALEGDKAPKPKGKSAKEPELLG